MKGVRIQGRYGYADNHDMLEFLGLRRTGKLPKEGMPIRIIQGVAVYVTPSEFKDTGTRRRQLKHRVFAICQCGRHIPTGRLHQHKCPGVHGGIVE